SRKRMLRETCWCSRNTASFRLALVTYFQLPDYHSKPSLLSEFSRKLPWCGVRDIELPARMMRSAAKSLRPTLALFNLVRKLEPVKARGVIDKDLALAFLTDVFSLEKDIDRTIESIAVRNIRAVEPALVAKLLDRKRQQFLVNLEAKVNLPTFDVFLW